MILYVTLARAHHHHQKEQTARGMNMGIAVHMHEFSASFASTRDLPWTDVLRFSLCLRSLVNFMAGDVFERT